MRQKLEVLIALVALGIVSSIFVWFPGTLGIREGLVYIILLTAATTVLCLEALKARGQDD